MSLKSRNGVIVWRRDDPCTLPPINDVIFEIFGKDNKAQLDSNLLLGIADAVIRYQPIPMLRSWLDTLSGGNLNGLEHLRMTSTRRVCGYVFKKDDIAWKCTTCQGDPTAVQCDSCFRQSNHSGHTVLFHRTGAGGCCDCGDEEAWAKEGCCPSHWLGGSDIDPISTLPKPIEKAARLVVRQVLAFMVEIAWDSIYSFEGELTNRWLLSGTGSEQNSGELCVRLHNDDVHTFEYVISVLVKLERSVQDAARVARKVDQEGLAIVTSGTAAKVLHTVSVLQQNSLLLSVSPQAHLDKEERFGQGIAWLDSLCARGDGLCRLVAEELMHWPLETPQRTRKSTILQVSETGTLLESDASAFYPILSAPLPLLMLSDPLLAKTLRSPLHALFMRLLVDPTFKRASACSFGRLYSTLHALYCHGIGTSAESLFGFSVQIFTSPSLVQLLDKGCKTKELCSPLASSSSETGPLPEGSVQGMLVQCLSDSFAAAGCTEDVIPEPDAFLDSPVILHKRYSHVFSDLEYALNCPGAARVGVPERWINLLSVVQGMDAIRRQTGAHVEFESHRWSSAYSLTLAISTVSEMLIDKELTADGAAGMAGLVEVCSIGLRNWVLNRPSTGEFYVQSGNVSVHLPLHRFMARLVKAAVGNDMGLPQFVAPNEGIEFVLEYPLRVLVWYAQVMSGLWVRNGAAIRNMAVTYATPPLCRAMRDIDIILLQYSATFLSRDEFMDKYLGLFWLNFWLNEPFNVYVTHTASNHIPAEKYLPLAEECLKLFIIIVTELPRSGENIAFETLRRELIHKLAVSDCPHSEVAEVAAIMGCGPENLLDAVLESICIPIGNRIVTPRKFELRDEAALEFDPGFFHLRKAEVHIAAERAASKIRKLKGSEWGGFPAVPPPPPAAHAFLAARWLLYSPAVLKFIPVVLIKCLKKFGGNHSDVLLSQAVHIVTLQLHCLAAPGSGHLPLDVNAPMGPKEYFDYLRASRSTSTFFLEFGNGSMVHLLGACALHNISGLGSLFKTGLEWVIREIALRDEESASILHKLGLPPRKLENEKGNGGTLNRPKQAQADAMAIFAKKQMEFARHMGIEDSESADEEEENKCMLVSAVSKEPIAREVGAPNCMVCHEVVNQNICYTGLAQRSPIISHGICSAPEHDCLNRQYRVVGENGCQIRSSAELNSEPVGLLPRNAEVVVVEQIGRRARIANSLVGPGWISVYSEDGRPILEPLLNFARQRWGKLRLNVGLCSHAAHEHCMEAYLLSLRNSRDSNPLIDERLIINMKAGEFLCPFCKSLGNILIPHIPRSLHAHTLFLYKKYASLGMAKQSRSLTELVDWVVKTGTKRMTSDKCLEAALAHGDFPYQSLPAHLLNDYADVVQRPLTKLVRSIDGASQYPTSVRCAGLGSTPLRHVHSLWSILSYSLICLESTSRVKANISAKNELFTGGSDAVRMQDILDARRIMRVVEHAPYVLRPPQDYATTKAVSLQGNVIGASLYASLVRSLAGVIGGLMTVPMQSTADDEISDRLGKFPRRIGVPAWIRKSVDLPLQVVWNIDDKIKITPDSRLPGITMRVQNVRAGTSRINRFMEKEAEVVLPDEWGSVDPKWPLSLVPLLAWDLPTLAVALASLLRNIECRCDALRILCIARLSQILIQPEFCLLGTVGSKSEIATIGDKNQDEVYANNSKDLCLASRDTELASALAAQRSSLAHINGISNLTGPNGSDLVNKAFGAWLPFLRFVALLLFVTEGVSNDVDTIQEGADTRLLEVFHQTAVADPGKPEMREAVEKLCQLLKVPDPISAWENSSLRGLVNSWGLQIAIAYEKPVRIDLAAPLHGQDFSWKFRDAYVSPYIDGSTDRMGRGQTGGVANVNANQNLNYVNLPGAGHSGMDISDSEASNEDENDMDIAEAGMDGIFSMLFQVQNEDIMSTPSSEESDGFDAENDLDSNITDMDRRLFLQLNQSPVSSDENQEEIRLEHIENTPMGEMLGRGPDGRSLRLRSRNPRLSFEAAATTAHYIDPPPRYILPYLGTLMGGRKLLTTSNGVSLARLYDLSHTTPSSWHLPGLVQLPYMFTELYARVKSPYTALGFPGFDPAVCLICGSVIAAGQRRGSPSRRSSYGGCTMHAYMCTAGTGIFFLVNRCTVLLLRDGKAAFWGSLYLDEHGEEDLDLLRGRPLYLNRHRCQLLCSMYIQHRVAQEVTTVRSNADRVIRENFY